MPASCETLLRQAQTKPTEREKVGVLGQLSSQERATRHLHGDGRGMRGEVQAQHARAPTHPPHHVAAMSCMQPARPASLPPLSHARPRATRLDHGANLVLHVHPGARAHLVAHAPHDAQLAQAGVGGGAKAEEVSAWAGAANTHDACTRTHPPPPLALPPPPPLTPFLPLPSPSPGARAPPPTPPEAP